MRNIRLVFNYENEFYGFSGLQMGRTTICFTADHLETLSYLLLSNPSYFLKVDFQDVYNFFGETAIDRDFLDAWEFEFETLKNDFLFNEEFSSKIKLPRRTEECFEFWQSLHLKENPVYYVSAITASWGLIGWSEAAKDLAFHWKMKRETPFFQFTTLLDALIYKDSLPEKFEAFKYIYVVLGNNLDFEHLGSLPNATSDFLTDFNNSINLNQLQQCYN